MPTLGLPRSSSVTHAITQGSLMLVQSAINSPTSAGGHVPDARLVQLSSNPARGNTTYGGWSGAAAQTCKQSSRGAVVVKYACT